MQVPCMGNKQSEDQDENTSPKEEYQEQCRQPEELSETICSGAILSGTKWKHEENMQQVWVQVHLKGGVTVKNLLMAPKDQDPMLNNSGVIYRYKCDRVDWDEEYIGESSRTFGERFKEHQKSPSPIYDHYNTTGHKSSIEKFSIVGREDQNLMRTIKEALYIRDNNPSLNRNIGKYHLPHIWDEVLFNTSELKIT